MRLRGGGGAISCAACPRERRAVTWYLLDRNVGSQLRTGIVTSALRRRSQPVMKALTRRRRTAERRATILAAAQRRLARAARRRSPAGHRGATSVSRTRRSCTHSRAAGPHAGARTLSRHGGLNTGHHARDLRPRPRDVARRCSTAVRDAGEIRARGCFRLVALGDFIPTAAARRGPGRRRCCAFRRRRAPAARRRARGRRRTPPREEFWYACRENWRCWRRAGRRRVELGRGPPEGRRCRRFRAWLARLLDERFRQVTGPKKRGDGESLIRGLRGRVDERTGKT